MASPSGNYCSICNVHDQWCQHIKPAPAMPGQKLTIEELERFIVDELRLLSSALTVVEVAVGLRDARTGNRVASYPIPRSEVSMAIQRIRSGEPA
jgi:hypothetical protein